jgi:hypothetical protein
VYTPVLISANPIESMAEVTAAISEAFKDCKQTKATHENNHGEGISWQVVGEGDDEGIPEVSCEG